VRPSALRDAPTVRAASAIGIEQDQRNRWCPCPIQLSEGGSSTGLRGRQLERAEVRKAGSRAGYLKREGGVTELAVVDFLGPRYDLR
jgi:hypothetical protein